MGTLNPRTRSHGSRLGLWQLWYMLRVRREKTEVPVKSYAPENNDRISNFTIVKFEILNLLQEEEYTQ